LAKKFYDVKVELNILRLVLQNKNFSSSVMTYNKITEEHFADQFCRDAWNVIKAFYNKYGKMPKKQLLTKYIVKYMTYYPDRFKRKESQLKIWRSSVSKLYNKINVDAKSEYDLFEEYRKLRLSQRLATEIVHNLEDENLTKIHTSITKAVSRFSIVENIITQGNIVDDLEEHFELDKKIKRGDIEFVKTNIVGVIDKENRKPKVVRLDEHILGGIYPKELTMLVGESTIGKSFCLMEMIYSATNFEKKNGILFTIEMDKIKQQRRIYSRATKIPYYIFKKGELTKQDKQILMDWRDGWQDDKKGIYEVVSFDKGATVIDVSNKITEIENKYGEAFEVIAVDYLQDMKPMGKYTDNKDWTALGEISWELTQLSKYHDDHRGIAVIVASQKKTKFYGKAETKLGSSMGSALPEHHATVTIGLGQNEDDAIMKRIRWDLSKNRDGERGISFYTYTDYAVSRIASVRKMKEFYSESESE
jgi:replicative DNA helicase